MKSHLVFFNISALVIALLFTGLRLNGQEFQTAEKAFTFKKADGSENKEIEPSAVQAINEKYLLVADDKTANLLIIETAGGKIVKSLPIPEFNVGKPKWEAMAYDGEFFYLIGSHAVKLDDTIDKLTKKLAARSHLLRFKLKNVGEDVSKIEIDSPVELDVTDTLKKSGLYNTNPNNNNVKIEGLAVRDIGENKRQLYFGLREPHDFIWVYSAEIPAMPMPNEKLSLEPIFSFESGKVGIVPFRLSSIEYVPKWNGFFVLTSTEDDGNAFYGNALWFVGNESLKNAQPSKPVTPQLVWLFDVNMKAEGLSILPNSTSETIHLVLVYDNDAEDTKKSGMMRMVVLTKKPK